MNLIPVSAENAEYQIILSLKTNRKKRSKLGEIFIEGIESVKQAVAAGISLTRIIISDYASLSGWAKELIAASENARIIEMPFALYKTLCDREEPSELLVTAQVKPVGLSHLQFPQNPFVLVFDRPGDQGNFGSVLRSANSFSVDAVFVIGHAIDVYDPKVIRSSLGSVFHSAIVHVNSMEELELWIAEQKNKNGLMVVGTDSTGERPLPEITLKKPIALVLGNEAKGMSLALKELCDYIVRIPLSGKVNSLNVSCAGTVFLWEIYKNSR